MGWTRDYLCRGLGLHSLVANEIHFMIACLYHKRGGTLATFTTYWMNFWKDSCCGLICAQHSCFVTQANYRNIEFTNLYTVGGAVQY